MFTARYAVSHYIKQARLVFKGLISSILDTNYFIWKCCMHKFGA